MFWGAILKESKPYVFGKESAGKILHLSSASLEDNVDPKPVYVHIESKGQKYILCVLRKEVNESVKLDNYLTGDEGCKLIVSNCPKGEVHITGYYEQEDVLNEDHVQAKSHQVEHKKHEKPVQKVKEEKKKPEPKKEEKKPVQEKTKEKQEKQVPERKGSTERKGSSDKKEEEKKGETKVAKKEEKKPEQKKPQPAATNPKKTVADMVGGESDEEDDIEGAEGLEFDDEEEGEDLDDEMGEDDEGLFDDAEDSDDSGEMKQFMGKKKAAPQDEAKPQGGKPHEKGQNGKGQHKGDKGGHQQPPKGGKPFNKGGNTNGGGDKGNFANKGAKTK